MKTPLFAILLQVSALTVSLAQPTCTSSPLTIPSSRDFSAITWTSSGGGVCPPASNFTGNIRIDLGNTVNITITSSITINGNFLLTNAGVSVLTIPAGVTVHVTGDMGDANNNSMTYRVNGELIVDGTLIGKNANTFEGTGSISGGTLDIKNGASCGTPCPVSGNFETCISDSGPNAQQFCESVLPVKLLYFNAHAEQEIVVLRWATTMEEDFLKFVVQRSTDGLSFEDIGEIEGRGFDIYDIQSKYSFEDVAPISGMNYYRLKAVDLDESFEYFGVKAVKVEGSRKLATFPNPSTGEVISFRTNFTAAESDRVILTDQLGNEIVNASAVASHNHIRLQTGLRPGIYMLRYLSDGFTQTTRIVVKH